MMKNNAVKIDEYRKGKFTQQEMANKLNLSERQYRRIEKDDCTPDIWTAYKIASILGTTVDKLWNIESNIV